MNESPRPPAPPSSEALLRYSILAQVEALLLGGCRAAAAVREVAARPHADPAGRAVRVSARTIQRWRAAYTESGIAGLEPKSRKRTETSVVLDEALVTFFQTEKESDPRASVPELIKRARERGILHGPIDRTTAWRACRRMGLPTRARPTKHEGDIRRWMYPHRMQCVLCDGKFFRAGAERLRRVALFFLDDATRFALEVRVGYSESSRLFLRGLHEMVMKCGLPDLLFLDHGPGFKSHDTRAVVEGGLGAWLVHGTVKYPQGRGVIERFNRTAQDQVLRSLDGAVEVDPDPGALTVRLRHYLNRYNNTPHETLGGDTPRQRWEAGRPLRLPEDEADLRRRFVVTLQRKVSADHIIQAGGKEWEAPRGLGAQTVQIARHVLDDKLWVLHDGKYVELAELDAEANATDRRGKAEGPVPTEGVPKTAATAAFDKDMQTVVGPDGGFHDHHPDTNNS